MTHVKGRHVYLSGPMTGLPNWNRAAFDEALWKLEKSGVPRLAIYNPADHIVSYEYLSHDVCLAHSIGELCYVTRHTNGTQELSYNLLVSLPGWEKSSGATLEREVAIACGIEVCGIKDAIA